MQNRKRFEIYEFIFKRRKNMRRKNLIKATLITTVIATILVSSGCGKKAANNDETEVQPVTVSAETASNAAKELAKTGLVTFNYTDADGNTYTLEGKAVASENGDTTIEVADAQGNKVTFTGKAKTINGKLHVSDIAVKDAGTLVKADGSKIEIATGATVADASESTEEESNSDISASDDVKQEIETAKKEESVIEAAREEVTKAESNVADNDNVKPEEPKNDTSNTPAQPDTTPEEAKKFVEQTGVDSLAVSIGTAHGEYKGIPHLNFERLQEIATEVSIPLVLHGGSGSGDENLSKAVELGIAKVNICTDLLNAARDNTKDGYAERSYYDSVTLAKDGFKDCLKHYYEVFHTK
mgnify:CR=1 FL=1